MLRVGMLVAVLISGATRAQAQSVASRLTAQAREAIEAFQFEAAALLKAAVEPQSAGSPDERFFALILLSAAQLNLGQGDSARATVGVAAALDPAQRVDSLGYLHADLVPMFTSAAAVARQRQPVRSTVTFRGLPSQARLSVDGTPWTAQEGSLVVGWHRVTAEAPGYAPLLDSVNVPSGVDAVVDLTMRALRPALLSVSSEPPGVVFLDERRLGETPLFERAVPAGTSRLVIRTPAGETVAARIVELAPGAALNLGTIGDGAHFGPSASELAEARALFRSLELDSAVKLCSRVARDTSSRYTRSLRAEAATWAAVILYYAGRARGRPSDRDSARVWFERALALDHRFRLPSASLGDSLSAFVEAARAAVLSLEVRASDDTLILPSDGRWAVEAIPSHTARVSVAINRAGTTGLVFRRESWAIAAGVTVLWEPTDSTRRPLPPGAYVLSVTALDSSGLASSPVQVRLRLDRELVDTIPHPRPLRTSDFEPETARLNRGPLPNLAFGLAVSAAAALLPSVGHAALNRDSPADPALYAVAGAVSAASAVGFLVGHRIRAVPSAVERNRLLRERDGAQRSAVAEQNSRIMANARIRIRTEGAR